MESHEANDANSREIVIKSGRTIIPLNAIPTLLALADYPQSQGESDAILLRRAHAEELHKIELIKAIRARSVMPLSHAGTTLGAGENEFLDLGHISVQAFIEYAESLPRLYQVRRAESVAPFATKWILRTVIDDEARDCYDSNFPEELAVEAQKESSLQQMRTHLEHDLHELIKVGAITPRNPSTGKSDKSNPLDFDCYLTRDDMETALQYFRANSEQRLDFLLEFKRVRGLGRYTLKQAAVLISDGGGELYKTILKRLLEAAGSYEIRTYRPGRNQKVTYGPSAGELRQVSEFYEEAYWNDLNDWLAKHEPRIGYLFPNPNTEPSNQISSNAAAASVNTPSEKPLSRQAFHESEVVRVLVELNYPLLAIPMRPNGLPGVRSEVRALLPKMSDAVFDKAWRGALKGRISYKK